MKRALILVSLFLFATALPAAAQDMKTNAEAKPLPSIEQKTANMEKMPGFFTYYWDAREGKIWLRVDKWNTEFLYVESLPNGVGSNDIGLDRGQPGEVQVVHFERSGPRVLLMAENERYRAVTDDAAQQQAVKQAFAQSVLWGFDAAADSGDAVLVDATPFFLHDTHNVIAKLKATKQGTFRLDPSRCAIYLPRTKNFPENSDVESTLTFTSEEPGGWVREVTPDPQSITVREHFSFVQAPPPGFHSREYDPRSGFFGIQYMDFATPVDQSIHKRFIVHYRLEKKDPSASVSEPVKPIVYYVDNAVPEPIRSALVEGASWWNQAFTAAGYKDAFQVKVLPEGVNPMDIRYNVIEWVPRATRGWSYGSAIVDPRTGEIINGHVNLDALRIRQVFLIAQGLLDPFGNDSAALRQANEMALARIRQLAAHETGHTIGLMHNFAGSTVNRSSVMDYPAPVVTVDASGAPDVSNAYAASIGSWDKVAVTYGYREFAPGTNEKQALNKILDDAFSNGQVYLSDQDARPLGSASPVAHLWDVGSNDLDGLKQVMAVRAAALKRFSEDAIPQNAPMATLEDVLVPIYLYHRYQVTAVAKSIGGMDYSFNVRGGAQKDPEIVPAAQQRAAIHAVLETLQPNVLALPASILKLIPPRPPEYPNSNENFTRRTSPAFDALAPAEAAAEIVASLLLEPNRAERMVEYHAREANYPGFADLVDDLLSATWKAQPQNGYDGAVQQTVNSVVLDHLMALAADDHAASETRAIASLKLDELKNWLGVQSKFNTNESRRAQFFFAAQEIERFEKNPAALHLTLPAPPPAGDPIGADGWQ
ncbi:MAG TPA: zinc-dependent metalloprotease [Candidatus Acidoferrales bacterium]|nr:zinc-dependent metalloprotease [Candidatus Acidoferrales bacterium]